MTSRQTMPIQWLVLNGGQDCGAWSSLRNLPNGSGILMILPLNSHQRRLLRSLAQSRNLTLVKEAPRSAARVHNISELRRALIQRTSLVLLSPMFRTLSHPEWNPIPRMRAATLARLGKRKLIALGGMDDHRYRTIARLGFIGWAGIGAWHRRNATTRS